MAFLFIGSFRGLALRPDRGVADMDAHHGVVLWKRTLRNQGVSPRGDVPLRRIDVVLSPGVPFRKPVRPERGVRPQPQGDDAAITLRRQCLLQMDVVFGTRLRGISGLVARVPAGTSGKHEEVDIGLSLPAFNELPGQRQVRKKAGRSQEQNRFFRNDIVRDVGDDRPGAAKGGGVRGLLVQLSEGVARDEDRGLFAGLARGLTGLSLTDPTSGLKALGPRGQALFALSRFPDRYPDADALVLARRARLSITERPARMRPSRNRRSMHGGLGAVAYVFNMLFSLFVATTGRDLHRKE